MCRGLTLNRVMLGENREIKIGDFEDCIIYDSDTLYVYDPPSQVYDYCCPEMINHQQGYTDMHCAPWAFGVILFAMLEGKLPFHDYDVYITKEKVLHCDYQFT